MNYDIFRDSLKKGSTLFSSIGSGKLNTVSVAEIDNSFVGTVSTSDSFFFFDAGAKKNFSETFRGGGVITPKPSL